MMGKYWKSIVAGLGALALVANELAEALAEGYGDGVWETSDTVTAAGAVITAVLVYLKANTTPGGNNVLLVPHTPRVPHDGG
jgi:hypothetical protein